LAPPVWSPDAAQIAFSEDYLHFAVIGNHFIGTPHGDGGIFVVNADGSGTTRISKKTAAALSWQRVQ
jgi:Tol biopolymer transport system component